MVDVNAVVDQVGVKAIVVGAFARDIHLVYQAGIPSQRRTEDLDLALAVQTWNEFEEMRHQLIASGSFRAVDGEPHRLRHLTSNIAVDLIPFGEIETNDRNIAWPPDGRSQMGVFGFREALRYAEEVRLPLDAAIQVISPASLALLKLIAWEERHLRMPKKDAEDLMATITHYLDIGDHRKRLLNDFSEWTRDDAFDLEGAGAKMLGNDIRQLLDADGIARMVGLLESQTNHATAGALALEMNSKFPDRALTLLRHVLQGLDGPM